MKATRYCPCGTGTPIHAPAVNAQRRRVRTDAHGRALAIFGPRASRPALVFTDDAAAPVFGAAARCHLRHRAYVDVHRDEWLKPAGRGAARRDWRDLLAAAGVRRELDTHAPHGRWGATPIPQQYLDRHMRVAEPELTFVSGVPALSWTVSLATDGIFTGTRTHRFVTSDVDDSYTELFDLLRTQPQTVLMLRSFTSTPLPMRDLVAAVTGALG